MHLQFKTEELDQTKASRGVLCAICGEYRFGSLEAVVMSDDSEEYGVVCPDCVNAGPKKASKVAYRFACDLRQQSDRQFRIAELLARTPESDWPETE